MVVGLAVVGAVLAPGPASAQTDVLAPSYLVVRSGLTPDQAQRLSAALQIGVDALAPDGTFHFVDPARFMVLPVNPVAGTPGGLENEDLEPVVLESINLDAVRAMAPPGNFQATLGVRLALRDAGIVLAGGTPRAGKVYFDLFRPGGLRTMHRPVATNVAYSFVTPDRTPLEGPGASAEFSIDGTGHPSLVRIATRQLSRGPDVPILSQDEARAACAEGYPAEALITATLVHYAPPLSIPVASILPYYRCNGTVATPGGGPVARLKSRYLPATLPGEPSGPPTVLVNAVIDGGTVHAQADVIGGTPPYRYLWVSSTTAIPPASFGPSINYDIVTRDPEAATTESVQAFVMDSNGLVASGGSSGNAPLPAPEVPRGPDPSARTTGIEYQSVTAKLKGSQYSALGFLAGTQAASPVVTNQFTEAEFMSWETDFRSSTLAGGDDHRWADAVDMVYYSGHGFAGGFTFTSDQQFKWIAAAQSLRLGDADLEWLALDTCEFLNNDDGLVVSRVKSMFQGLHIVLGFHTVAADSYDLGGIFTDDMFGTVTNPNSHSYGAHLTVVQAWALAAIITNPSDKVWAAMGPTGPNGISNVNDRFWGFGSVGPDIRGTDIKGYWRLSGST